MRCINVTPVLHCLFLSYTKILNQCNIILSGPSKFPVNLMTADVLLETQYFGSALCTLQISVQVFLCNLAGHIAKTSYLHSETVRLTLIHTKLALKILNFNRAYLAMKHKSCDIRICLKWPAPEALLLKCGCLSHISFQAKKHGSGRMKHKNLEWLHWQILFLKGGGISNLVGLKQI